MSGREVEAALLFTVGRLKAEPALAGVPVWSGVAPDAAEFPLLLVQLYGSAVDVSGMSYYRSMTTVDVIVRAVDQSDDLASVLALAESIDGVLHGVGPVEVAAGVVQSCQRVSATQFADVEAGKTFQYAGGVYRLQVS